MKLVEYRFPETSPGSGLEVASAITDFFEAVGDIDLLSIGSLPGEMGGISREVLNIADMHKTCYESFESSLNLSDSSKRRSIKSRTSCRFIIFEDDAVIRICYATEDSGIEFGSPVVGNDISRMLIETDFFDFT